MPFAFTKNVDWVACTRRVWNAYFFGNADPLQVGNTPITLNSGTYPGEYATGINAAGNGPVNMIGVDGNNLVVLPTSSYFPAGIASIGGQIQGPPMFKTVSYDVAANASIGTTAFFTADQPYTVAAIAYSQKTQGTGTAVSNVTHDTGTQAAGAGTSIQTGTFACSTIVNNTVTAGVLTATTAALTLATGDRLSIVFTGTTTTLAGVLATVSLIPTAASETSQYYARVNGDVATQNFFCANRDMVVTGISIMFGTAFATAVTLQVTHDATTAAPGAGSALLATALIVDGSVTAINTVATPALTATTANLTLRAGDRLSTKFSATTTGAGVIVVVTFAPLYLRKEVSWQLAINGQEQVAQNFFTADRSYEIVDASCSYGTAAGGAAKIAVTIDKGTTAPGAGNVVQTDNTNAGFDLNTTTGTAQFMTPASVHLRLMSPGDRLGLAVTGGAQSIADVVITCSLRPNY